MKGIEMVAKARVLAREEDSPFPAEIESGGTFTVPTEEAASTLEKKGQAERVKVAPVAPVAPKGRK